MAPEAARALAWRRMVKAGYPVSASGLGFFDLWLLSMVEEIEHEEIEPNDR